MKNRIFVSFLLFGSLLAASLANAQVKPQRVRVAPPIAANLLKTYVPPDYPQEAKDKHIEGNVVLKVTIDKNGDVANAEVVSGEALLAPAAIEAVKKWKYRPFVLNGAPLAMETQVTVNFSLKK